MIGYRVSKDKLEELITAHNATWLTRASDRTEHFRQLGRYEEASTIWGEVKEVYIVLQERKCSYCERLLEGEELGKAEYDVEHFRPKGSVRKWAGSTPNMTPAPAQGGYYLLAYHPFNYAASCKPCNSALKGDKFPILGPYQLDGDDPTQMGQEQPLLLYPIGDFDDKPEALIGFNGVSPHARYKTGYRNARALATIEFFELDGQRRKNLFQERARVLVALYPALRDQEAPHLSQEERQAAKDVVTAYVSRTAPHTNCSRSFRRLFNRSPDEARAFYLAASQYLRTIS